MKTRHVILIVLAVLALPVLAVGGFAGYLWISGTPVIDEWSCSDGEAPYVYPEGGGACAEEGADLPPRAEWDPFGNRPLSCHDRWGWVEVERTDPSAGAPAEPGETDCVEKGEAIPDGWQPVD